MSGKQLTFYAISGDFLGVAIKLCEKLYEAKENVLFLCNTDADVKTYDSKLWTYSKLSFIPHGSRFSVPLERAEDCKIWLSTEIEFINKPTCLLHNGVNNISDSAKNFEKIVDIFDAGSVELAKVRAAKYSHLGFIDKKIWRQDASGWKNSEDF